MCLNYYSKLACAVSTGLSRTTLSAYRKRLCITRIYFLKQKNRGKKNLEQKIGEIFLYGRKNLLAWLLWCIMRIKFLKLHFGVKKVRVIHGVLRYVFFERRLSSAKILFNWKVSFLISLCRLHRLISKNTFWL